MKLFSVSGDAASGSPEQLYFVAADDGDEAVSLANNDPTANGLTLEADAKGTPLPEYPDAVQGIKARVPSTVFQSVVRGFG